MLFFKQYHIIQNCQILKILYFCYIKSMLIPTVTPVVEQSSLRGETQ